MSVKRSTTVFFVIAGVGLLIASFNFGFYVGRGSAVGPGKFALLEEIEERIRASAEREASSTALLRGAANGMLDSLGDPYAAFLDPSTYASVRDEVTAGVFSGVGLWLKQDEQDRVKVVKVLENTPASRAGVQDDDIIVRVGSKAVEGLELDEVTARIQGRPGTTLTLTLVRGGGPPQELQLRRERIQLPSVTSRMVDRNIGVVELIEFSGGSGEKVRQATTDLLNKGAKAFILDLRGNPGGAAVEAIKVASVFLDKGPVMSQKQRGKAEVFYEARDPQLVIDLIPLVVLVDEGSASSAEIVAGAIQDRGRGIIVGTSTYGKGSVQSIYELSDGSAVKFTTATFHTPSGRSIGEDGLAPDVAVTGKAEQFDRARDVLSKMLAEAPKSRR